MARAFGRAGHLPGRSWVVPWTLQGAPGECSGSVRGRFRFAASGRESRAGGESSQNVIFTRFQPRLPSLLCEETSITSGIDFRRLFCSFFLAEWHLNGPVAIRGDPRCSQNAFWRLLVGQTSKNDPIPVPARSLKDPGTDAAVAISARAREARVRFCRFSLPDGF